MCGLFGAHARHLSDAERDVCMELGVLASLRGRDSTGLAIVGTHKNKPAFRIKKHPINATSFLYHNEVQKFVNENKPYAMAGHCRWATVGAINKANAHPFMEGRYIGMHNGTISAYSPPKEKMDEESDSMLLYRFMAESNPEEAIYKGRDGAMALVWFDIGNRTLNFFRNDKRTLYWSLTTANTFYWASEAGALGYMHVRSPFNFGDPTMFAVNKIHTYKLGEVVPAEITDLSPKLTKVVYPVSSHGPGHFRRQAWADWEGSDLWDEAWHAYDNGTTKVESDSSSEGTKPIGGTKNSSVPLLPAPPLKPDPAKPYSGYGGIRHSTKAAQSLLNNGCSCCGQVFEPKDEVLWFSNTEYICRDCVSLPVVQEYMHVPYTTSKLEPEENEDSTGS